MLKIAKKGKNVQVTFTIPAEEAGEVESIALMGEWNDWEPEVMKQKKNGDFYLSKVLEADKNYQFGYYAEGNWKTDADCNSVESPFGSYNSLLELEQQD